MISPDLTTLQAIQDSQLLEIILRKGGIWKMSDTNE
jgi:hypothetical protein